MLKRLSFLSVYKRGGGTRIGMAGILPVYFLEFVCYLQEGGPAVRRLRPKTPP
jgi:hypothetical protein